MSSAADRNDPLRAFIHAHRAGRLAHAYVLVGDPTREGAPLARRMIAALACAQPDADGFPCGSCPSCRTIERDEFPDICWIRPSSKSRMIRIKEDIRETVIPFLSRTSYTGGWKTLVIEEADCLNVSSGNALLKSLEEPGARTLILLLTAAPDQLLPTIRSRCHTIKAAGFGRGAVQDEWAEHALNILSRSLPAGLSERLVAVSAMTALFDAIKKAAEPIVEQEEADDVARNGQDWTKEQREARLGSQYKQMQQSTLRAILSWHRDAMAVASGGKALNHPDHAAAIGQFVQTQGYAGVAERTRRAKDAVRQIDRNISPATAWSGYFL